MANERTSERESIGLGLGVIYLWLTSVRAYERANIRINWAQGIFYTKGFSRRVRVRVSMGSSVSQLVCVCFWF